MQTTRGAKQMTRARGGQQRARRGGSPPIGERPQWTQDTDTIPRLLESIQLSPGLATKICKPPAQQRPQRLGGRLAVEARNRTLDMVENLDDFMQTMAGARF